MTPRDVIQGQEKSIRRNQFTADSSIVLKLVFSAIFYPLERYSYKYTSYRFESFECFEFDFVDFSAFYFFCDLG